MNSKYPAEDTVSVWIGTFADEGAMDHCTDVIIEPSLKLTQPLASICEIAFENDPVPIRQLLEGFSGWETFVDEACKIAASLGAEKANGALVCYYLYCNAPPDHWPGVLYLGTLGGRDIS